MTKEEMPFAPGQSAAAKMNGWIGDRVDYWHVRMSFAEMFEQAGDAASMETRFAEAMKLANTDQTKAEIFQHMAASYGRLSQPAQLNKGDMLKKCEKAYLDALALSPEEPWR